MMGFAIFVLFFSWVWEHWPRRCNIGERDPGRHNPLCDFGKRDKKKWSFVEIVCQHENVRQCLLHDCWIFKSLNRLWIIQSAIQFERLPGVAKFKDISLPALTGKEKVWRADYTSTLNTINNLRIQYLNQGKMKKAKEMCLPVSTRKKNKPGMRNTHRCLTQSTIRDVCIRIEAGWVKPKKCTCKHWQEMERPRLWSTSSL